MLHASSKSALRQVHRINPAGDGSANQWFVHALRRPDRRNPFRITPTAPKYSEYERPRNAIRNCDVKFGFECPINWNELDRTGDNRFRHCQVCAERVFLCCTAIEALGHAKVGHCVALPGQDGSAARFRMVLGRPAPLTHEQKALVKAEKADQAVTKKIRAATKHYLRKV